jgi:hypothetical protein
MIQQLDAGTEIHALQCTDVVKWANAVFWTGSTDYPLLQTHGVKQGTIGLRVRRTT